MARIPAKPTKPVAKRPKSAKKTGIAAKISPKPAEIPEPADNTLIFNNELCSISALSRLFNIDRATIRDRIEKAGIKPKSIREKEKLYELDERLEMVLRQDELAEAKLKKLELEGEKLEHDLAIKRGEYGSVAEFTEITQKIFGRLHKKVVVQLPKRLSARLHNANSSAEVMQILETELAQEFNDLRSNFEKYI